MLNHIFITEVQVCIATLTNERSTAVKHLGRKTTEVYRHDMFDTSC